MNLNKYIALIFLRSALRDAYWVSDHDDSVICYHFTTIAPEKRWTWRLSQDKIRLKNIDLHITSYVHETLNVRPFNSY